MFILNKYLVKDTGTTAHQNNHHKAYNNPTCQFGEAVLADTRYLVNYKRQRNLDQKIKGIWIGKDPSTDERLIALPPVSDNHPSVTGSIYKCRGVTRLPRPNMVWDTTFLATIQYDTKTCTRSVTSLLSFQNNYEKLSRLVGQSDQILQLQLLEKFMQANYEASTSTFRSQGLQPTRRPPYGGVLRSYTIVYELEDTTATRSTTRTSDYMPRHLYSLLNTPLPPTEEIYVQPPAEWYYNSPTTLWKLKKAMYRDVRTTYKPKVVATTLGGSTTSTESTTTQGRQMPLDYTCTRSFDLR